MPDGRMPLEELAALPVLGAVTRSWSRDRTAFHWNKTGRFELYTMDLRTREVRQATDGQLPATPRSGYAWTRDDASLVFGPDDADKEQHEQHDLHELDLETGELGWFGEAREGRSEGEPAFSADGRLLAVHRSEAASVLPVVNETGSVCNPP